VVGDVVVVAASAVTAAADPEEAVAEEAVDDADPDADDVVPVMFVIVTCPF
jgi:hypothetical protein